MPTRVPAATSGTRPVTWEAGAANTRLAIRVVVPFVRWVCAAVRAASGPSANVAPPPPWQCMSTKPGARIRPRTSITGVPAGGAPPPTSRIRPPPIATHEAQAMGVRCRASPRAPRAEPRQGSWRSIMPSTVAVATLRCAVTAGHARPRSAEREGGSADAAETDAGRCVHPPDLTQHLGQIHGRRPSRGPNHVFDPDAGSNRGSAGRRTCQASSASGPSGWAACWPHCPARRAVAGSRSPRRRTCCGAAWPSARCSFSNGTWPSSLPTWIS